MAKRGVVSSLEIPRNKKLCIHCGRIMTDNTSNFYSSNGAFLYEGLGLCKKCLNELLDVGDMFSVHKILSIVNKPFVSSVWDSAKESKTVFSTYMQRIPLNHGDKEYKDGEQLVDVLKEEIKKNMQYVKENSEDNEKIESFDCKEVIEKKPEINDYTEKREDTIRLLGYDPFIDYTEEDKQYLYNEIVPYLDEDTLDDQYKIGVILQILINNNQIRKINLAMNKLSDSLDSMIQNGKEISTLTDITNKLNMQNDRLSKENQIALKHRGGSSKKSTLGSTMKELRELNFEKAEHNYYDMKKAYGMKVSADISNKSILEIIHFDDNDKNIIFKNQRDELQKLQEKELDYREEIRKLVKENTELKNKLNEIEKKDEI